MKKAKRRRENGSEASLSDVFEDDRTAAVSSALHGRDSLFIADDDTSSISTDEYPELKYNY